MLSHRMCGAMSSSDREASLAILRRQDGLFTFEVHRLVRDDQENYADVLAPLQRSDDVAPLLDAWESLAAVREIAPAVTAAVNLILDETVVDPVADRAQLPPLGIELPPARYKPTAANPRAYKGTKDKPPKPRRPEPMDLRPYLCDTAGQDRLLRLLREQTRDVHLAREERGQPPRFRRYFERLLRDAAPGVRSAALSAYHQLGLEDEPELCRAVAFLFAKQPASAGPWCAILATIQAERRLQFIKMLWEVDAAALHGELPFDELCQADQLTSDEQFPGRMRYALSRVAAGGDDLKETLFMFRLTNEHLPDHEFDLDDPPPSPAGCQAITSFLDRFPGFEGWFAARLMEECGKHPRFGDVVAGLLDATIEPKHVYRLAELLSWAHECRDPDEAWSNILRELTRCHSVLAALPEPYQGKGVALIGEFAGHGDASRLGFALSVLPSICSEPFAVESQVHDPIEVMSGVPDDDLPALLGAPVSSYATLEARCLRRNEATLVSMGMGSLRWKDPELLVDAFVATPAALCRMVRTLGLLSSPVRVRLIEAFALTPHRASAAELAALDSTALVELIDAVGSPEASALVPRQLRLHLRGDVELRPGQVRRHQDKIIASWPAVCCEALRQQALAELRLGLIDEDEVDFGDLSEKISHALMIQSGTEENRRGLRRLIRACYEGDVGYVENHPANRSWLARHPQLTVPTWLAGIELTRECGDSGMVTLSLETDPLEALRLGTYVGSCLGVGGGFTFSAAATVLDINKQVIFARDAEGRFLARQIVAISDEGKLVCFEVYPRLGPAMQQLFIDYDRAFATAIGTTVLTENHVDDERGDVSRILSQGWHDDGAWSLEVDED